MPRDVARRQPAWSLKPVLRLHISPQPSDISDENGSRPAARSVTEDLRTARSVRARHQDRDLVWESPRV